MPLDIKARELAKSCILSRSFRTGKFTLASGEKSSYYIDLKPTMMDSIGLNSIAKLILAKIDTVFSETHVDYIAGLELGAVPLISAVVTLGNGFPHGVIVRKQSKSHGTNNLIEGLMPNETLLNKNVLIIEDVTTSGQSSWQAVEAVQRSGGTVSLVLSVVDREQGAREFYQSQGIEFDCLFTVSEIIAEFNNKNNTQSGWSWVANFLKFKR